MRFKWVDIATIARRACPGWRTTQTVTLRQHSVGQVVVLLMRDPRRSRKTKGAKR